MSPTHCGLDIAEPHRPVGLDVMFVQIRRIRVGVMLNPRQRLARPPLPEECDPAKLFPYRCKAFDEPAYVLPPVPVVSYVNYVVGLSGRIGPHILTMIVYSKKQKRLRPLRCRP